MKLIFVYAYAIGQQLGNCYTAVSFFDAQNATRSTFCCIVKAGTFWLVLKAIGLFEAIGGQR